MWYPIQMQHEVLHSYLATSQKIQVCFVGEQTIRLVEGDTRNLDGGHVVFIDGSRTMIGNQACGCPKILLDSIAKKVETPAARENSDKP